MLITVRGILLIGARGISFFIFCVSFNYLVEQKYYSTWKRRRKAGVLAWNEVSRLKKILDVKTVCLISLLQ